MKRVLAGVAAGLLSVGLAAAPAAADPTSPAQNRPACEGEPLNGVFTEPNAFTNVCVVTGEPVTEPVRLRDSGNSGRGWDSLVTYTPVTTYTRTVIQGPGGPEFDDTTVKTNVVTSCTNPGGQPMEPGEGQCPMTL